jgi:uncharacterized damage-inducible protein DinB
MKGASMHTDTQKKTSERADLLETLAAHRGYLLKTVQGITDEQAGLRPTVSELCLGGIIKHVALMEERWGHFIVEGPQAIGPVDATAYERHVAGFQMEGETLAALLAHYERVARRTDELVDSLPSLDDSHPLPEAPWFEEGASWSARRTLLHVIAETAQHAGHADVIRETIDGARTMG